MVGKNIYEPLDIYKHQLKDAHAKNVSDYFEDLVKASGINESLNAETVKAIKNQEKLIRKSEKRVGKYRFLRIMLILLIVSAAIFTYVFYTGAFNESGALGIRSKALHITLMIVSLLLIVLSIFLIFKKINPMVKEIETHLKGLRDKHQSLLDEAWGQMRPLNQLYDWGIPVALMQKTVPLIKLDPYFDSERFDFMNKKYGLAGSHDGNHSMLFVQSGEIIGNPFVLVRDLEHELGTKIYTGTRTITWTETTRVNGRTQVVTRSQVLTASVTKPCPYYYKASYIIYSNEAAPNLSFSREPADVHNLTEKQIERLVDKGEDKLEAKSRKAVKEGKSFNAMSNTEFETLFNATDRDNEVEFRLLFDPLAQREMIKLLTDNKVGYGDNFYFYKRKYLNYVQPKHLENLDLDADPSRYMNYDLSEARRIFNTYNNEYFKGFYFALAPILSIPLYQQYKPKEYIYKHKPNETVAPWEHEALANNLPEDAFKIPESNTQNILKTKVNKRLDGLEEVEVHASGYQTIQQIDHISVWGGDGRMHLVPVPWIEYIPVSKTTSMNVKPAEQVSRQNFVHNVQNSAGWQSFFKGSGDFKQLIFRRGIIAFKSFKEMTAQDNKVLDDILYDKKQDNVGNSENESKKD